MVDNREADQMRRDIESLRTLATATAAAFQTHEQVCGERQKQILVHMKALMYGIAFLAVLQVLGPQHAVQAAAKWMGLS